MGNPPPVLGLVNREPCSEMGLRYRRWL